MRNNNTITLNGQPSTTIPGLIIQELPAISKPLMRTETEQIDGRAGDIVTELGFSAYDKELTIGLAGNYDINQVIAYFNSQGTVIFSNEPDKFYNYQITAQIDFERLVRYRTATVTMHCQPYKYAANEGDYILDPPAEDLLTIPNFTKTTNGVTVTVTDNVLNVSGTPTTATEFYVPITALSLDAGSYTLIATSNGTNANYLSIRLIGSSPSDADSFGGRYISLAPGTVTLQGTLTASKTYKYIWLYMNSGQKFNFSTTFELTNDAEKTATGEGTEIVLPNTAEAPFTQLDLKGDTSQQTYTGKNLVGATATFPMTVSGLTATKEEDGSITLNGTRTAATHITLATGLDLSAYDGQVLTISVVATGTGGFSNIGIKQGTSTNLLTTAQLNGAGTRTATGTVTFSDYNNVLLDIWISASYAATEYNNYNLKVQLEKGETATEYEQFVGGTASPNPDYPQAVQVVTGEQTIKVTGKNLLKFTEPSSTVAGVEITINQDGTATLNGTATGDSWKNLARDYSLPNYNLWAVDSTTQSVAGGGYTYSASISNGVLAQVTHGASNGWFAIKLKNGETYNNAVLRLQLEAGTVATDWQPYQSQEYTLNLGGNLFDQDSTHLAGYLNESGEPTSSDYSVYYADYIPVSSNSTYTLSYTVVTWGTSVRYVAFYDANKAFISRTSFEATSNATITTPSNAKFIRISFRNQGGVSASAFVGNYLRNIQLEAGTKATPYTPYTPYAKIELCKIGTYQDYFYKDGEDWYLHEEIGKVILDGTEGWKGNSNVFYSLPKTDSKMAGLSLETYGNLKSICSHFTKNVYDANNIGQYYSGSTNLNFNWDNSHTNLASFKTWLASNDVRFYAPLTTATDTQITNTALIEQLETLKSQAHSYKGTTYIKATSDGTHLPHIIAATVTKDSSGQVINSGNTTAKPTLTIYGAGNIGVYLNGVQVFQIALGDEGYITIDTAAMEAYHGTTETLKNRLVTGDYNNFALLAGTNDITFSGNVSECILTNYSRWL